MGVLDALLYVGGALGYAAGLTAVLWASGRGLGHAPGPAWCALLLASAFAVFLGLHPFPDPAMLACDDPPRPAFRPFGYVGAFRSYWQEGRPPADWLTSKSIMAPIMNVVLFAPAGMALARVRPGPGRAVLLGLGLTVFIETAQITGLFGIYPCPYRQFETDDLILNLTGVVLGSLAVQGWRRARS